MIQFGCSTRGLMVEARRNKLYPGDCRRPGMAATIYKAHLVCSREFLKVLNWEVARSEQCYGKMMLAVGDLTAIPSHIFLEQRRKCQH